MLCKNCQHDIADDSTFCSHCGAAQGSPVQPQQQPPQGYQAGQPYPQAKAASSRPPRRRRRLAIAAASILAIAVLALVGAFAIGLLNAFLDDGQAAGGGGWSDGTGSLDWDSPTKRDGSGKGDDSQADGPDGPVTDPGDDIGPTPAWSGGVTAVGLPDGYAAIIDNEYATVGLGRIRPYYEADGSTTLQVDLYIINKSNVPIYMIFRNNVMNGRSVDYKQVFVSIFRTDPGREDHGVVYIEALNDPDALDTWRGSLLLIDDDTYYSPEVDILGEYWFDLTYQHPSQTTAKGDR